MVGDSQGELWLDKCQNRAYGNLKRRRRERGKEEGRGLGWVWAAAVFSLCGGDLIIGGPSMVKKIIHAFISYFLYRKKSWKVLMDILH